MTDFRFAEPQLVHLLWVVIASVGALVWLERRGGRALGRFVSPLLQDRLVSRPSRARRALRLTLLGLAAGFLVAALMRPQWGGEQLRTTQVGAEIMIALDVSKSMLAEDVAPNRLARAKAEIRDLLRYLEGNPVGLIAFAGRASVVSPLTPDFGFLRLVLDTVDSTTVRRGGTRLEEPIRKAVDGFGETGDVERILLLITDGEDHDSFPKDAAEAAAERGVRIIAVGFGDEAGSEIRVTDPQTGARSLVRDADGRPVVTRLDGALLRELALATEGAYIPAGTGVLDLESIFEAHIAPRMRSGRSTELKSVRNEAYQWAVLLALVCLLGSVATHAAPRASRSSSIAPLALALVLLAGTAMDARAQSGNPTGSATGNATGSATGNTGPPTSAPLPPDEASATARARLQVPEDPREAYNRGLEALQAGRLDDAETYFEATRSQASVDGEARFRATFNLAWVDVRRADALLEADPEAALRSLERAADWFRGAVRLRPKHEDARRNLEIVLQRIVALADSLARRDPGDVATRLEALIEAQRGVLGPVRELVDAVARSDDVHAVDALRPAFRATEVEERSLLSTAQQLSQVAGDELQAIENLSDEERSPEDTMRLAQLSGVLHYVHRARERMGQARSQLRQRQAERAYRRGATALGELKRARDQLLDPVQVLDALLADAAPLVGETRGLVALAAAPPLGADSAASVPAWLTPSYLRDRQEDMTARTEELAARLRAGLTSAGAVEDPAQQDLLARIEAAEPFLATAETRFRDALGHLESERVAEAVLPQIEGVAALAQARERFFDLKRLIEASYADQRRIDAVLNPRDDPERGVTADQALEQLPEFAPVLVEAQTTNLDRVRRMQPILEQQLERLNAPPSEAEAQDPAAAAEARSQRRDQIVLATEVLALADSAMQSANDQLPALATDSAALQPARDSVALAVQGLENLRRIFFSILEHLQDAARQQQELNDETTDATALAGDDPAALTASLGPLASRQEQLGERTDKLAMALHEQSQLDPAELVGSEQPLSEEDAQAVTERFVRASELVLAAQAEMAEATAGMKPDEPAPDRVREAQTAALTHLLEALQVLQPPPPPEPEDEGEEQQDQQQQQQQQQQQRQQEQAEPEDQRDPSQLLQQVRDREAERHRDRRNRGQRQSEPVEKDW